MPCFGASARSARRQPASSASAARPAGAAAAAATRRKKADREIMAAWIVLGCGDATTTGESPQHTPYVDVGRATQPRIGNHPGFEYHLVRRRAARVLQPLRVAVIDGKRWVLWANCGRRLASIVRVCDR